MTRVLYPHKKGETKMSKTDLLKSGLQLFAGGEDVAIDSILDLLGDHGDMTANMSDEAVAMLVIASRFENIARTSPGSWRTSTAL